MMAVDHYMRWNEAGYFRLEHGDWEDAERMSSPRVHSHARPKIYRHSLREYQLEGTENPKLVAYDLRPVDPRMSTEELSWAIWEGNESTRLHWDLMIRRGRGPSHKVQTPEDIAEQDRLSKMTPYKKWKYKRDSAL